MAALSTAGIVEAPTMFMPWFLQPAICGILPATKGKLIAPMVSMPRALAPDQPWKQRLAPEGLVGHVSEDYGIGLASARH